MTPTPTLKLVCETPQSLPDGEVRTDSGSDDVIPETASDAHPPDKVPILPA